MIRSRGLQCNRDRGFKLGVGASCNRSFRCFDAGHSIPQPPRGAACPKGFPSKAFEPDDLVSTFRACPANFFQPLIRVWQSYLTLHVTSYGNFMAILESRVASLNFSSTKQEKNKAEVLRT